MIFKFIVSRINRTGPGKYLWAGSTYFSKINYLFGI